MTLLILGLLIFLGVHSVSIVAPAWRDAQVSAVRFNFRGVGRSTGKHDDGAGEVEDARAALDWVAQQNPGVPLYGSGFSFGCRTILQLALGEPRIERVLAVGLAVDLFDVEFVVNVKQKVAFVHGDRDEYGALANLESLMARMQNERCVSQRHGPFCRMIAANHGHGVPSQVE